MTIENSIETLTSILDEATESEESVCYVTSADAGSLKLAISTMRKYQKIEQIVSDFKDFQKAFNVDFGGDMYMQMVNEVVEDENNNM